MSNRLKEMREKQAKIVAEARERLDLVDKADESRAKELEAQHDAAMAEYDKLEVQINREQKLVDIEARMHTRHEEERARNRPTGRDAETRGTDDGDKLEYRHVFHKFLASGADITMLEPEERALLRAGVVDDKAKAALEQRAQSVGTTTAGGFTVPTELAAFIVRSMKAWGPMYDDGICTTISTASGAAIKVPTVDDTGVTATAHTENTALTDTGDKDVTFGQKSLDAFVFDTHFIRWSYELAQDSIFSMEALLGDLLGERLGRIANSQLTTGTGTGAPNGVVTAASAGKTAASATAIASDEIIDLLHSVDPAYRSSPKARFMFNDTTLQAVRKLKDGQGNYLWQMGDVSKGVPGSLLGYPFSINQALASIATGNKTMLFGDFSKYFVRKVGDFVIGVLRERFWPDLGIAGLVRFDGELGDAAAIKYLIQA